MNLYKLIFKTNVLNKIKNVVKNKTATDKLYN